MLTSRLFMACTFVIALACPTILFAIWGGNGDRTDLPTPSRLVVKFRSDVQFSGKSGDNKYLSTEISSLDALNRKYRISKQQAIISNTFTVGPDNPLLNVYVLNFENSTDLESIAENYELLDIVEYAHPDYHLQLFDAPDDSLYPHQWAHNNTGQGYYHVERIGGFGNDTLAIVYGAPDADIDALELYENPPDNTTAVIVAIVDSGIDRDHPELATKIWINSDEIPDNDIDDDHNGYIDDHWGWDFSAHMNPPCYQCSAINIT